MAARSSLLVLLKSCFAVPPAPRRHVEAYSHTRVLLEEESFLGEILTSLLQRNFAA